MGPVTAVDGGEPRGLTGGGAGGAISKKTLNRSKVSNVITATTPHGRIVGQRGLLTSHFLELTFHS